jgi:hypothetical protein
LYISWDDDELSEDLKPINLMQKLRKFETDYMSEEMFAQLELNQLQDFRIYSSGVDPLQNYSDFLDDDFDEALPREILESRSASWKSFVNNNCQLEVLDLPDISISLELLQITLENLPFLKSLRVRVDGCNYSTIKFQPKYDFEEYQVGYVIEQSKKAAKLIGENYDRFEHLLLKLEEDGCFVTEHLEKYYSNVKIEMRSYDETQREKSLEEIEKSFKLVILMY